MFAAEPLRDEARAPDDGGGEKKEICAERGELH
jgi:hypothetical protein